MADEKVSQLPAATLPLNDNDLFYVVQNTTSTSSSSQNVKFVDLSSQIRGGFATGLIFVEKKVVSSASTSVTFSGLNGDVDGVYYLLCRLKAATASTAIISIRPNGVTTNQNSRLWFSTSTTDDTILRIGSMSSGQFMISDLTFHANSTVDAVGRTRHYLSNTCNGAGGSILNVGLANGCWNDTSTNITSLDIVSSVANHIGIGSELILYKYAQS